MFFIVPVVIIGGTYKEINRRVGNDSEKIRIRY